jgi:hypothetical protein
LAMSELKIINLFGGEHPNFPNAALVHVVGGDQDGEERVISINELIEERERKAFEAGCHAATDEGAHIATLWIEKEWRDYQAERSGQ